VHAVATLGERNTIPAPHGVEAGKPTFLIHGERDEVIPLKEIRKFYGQLSEPKELVVIDGADHLFDGKVSEVGDGIEDLLQDFDG
jgi:putative redox protein